MRATQVNFKKLISYIQNVLLIKVRVEYDNSENTWYCNGEAGENEVVLYKHTKGKNWGAYFSILQHEVSHVFLSHRPHSEKEAWQMAKLVFPKSMLPKSFDYHRKKCYDTYKGQKLKKIKI